MIFVSAKYPIFKINNISAVSKIYETYKMRRNGV